MSAQDPEEMYENRLIGFLPWADVGGPDVLTVAPTGLSGTAEGTTAIQWSWDALNGAAQYRVNFREKP